MILTLAWRNIWRNPTRSLVVILAIALGIWAAMFMSGFATGMANSYVNNAIQNMLSHLQVHIPEYQEEADVTLFFAEPEEVLASAKKQEAVSGASLRTLVNGMVASSHSSRGVEIRGVVPEQEASVTQLEDNVIAGTFFGESRKNQILLGKKMAENLEVKERSKVVLTFQDLEGNITAGAFRISGIFESGNTPFDESTVLVKRRDLNRLLLPTDTSRHDSLGVPESGLLAHELAVMLSDPGQLDTIQSQLQANWPALLVQNYRELSPDLRLYESQIQNISLIYLVIILLALIFGIINTMLMAVLERFRELGMLMAVGMNRLRVFTMIMLETIMLTLIGMPIGLLIGHLTVVYFRRVGIDLSAFSTSMQQYGLSEQLFFDLDPVVYVQVPVGIMITAVLASIYPAWKAIRLRPVEAIRKI